MAHIGRYPPPPIVPTLTAIILLRVSESEPNLLSRASNPGGIDLVFFPTPGAGSCVFRIGCLVNIEFGE